MAFAVGLVDKFMQSTQETHLKTARRIFGYFKGTLSFALKFRREIYKHGSWWPW